MTPIVIPVESDGQGGIKNVSYAVGNQARLALPAVTTGFTPIVTSVDTRKIYVSTSGDDANDGLSPTRPIKSITYGVSLLRSGFPDHLLLKRGDRFRIAPKGATARDNGKIFNFIPSGRSRAEPLVVCYYGDEGDRPVIEAEGEVIRDRTRRHIRFIGFHLYGYKKDPMHPEHNPSSGSAAMSFVGDFHDILIEDCKLDFADALISINNQSNTRPSDMVLRRNIFTGIYSNNSSYSRAGRTSCIFSDGVDGQRYEENVFDFGGWYPGIVGAGGNALSHCLYLQWRSDGNKTVFNKNICTRGASHGVQMRAGGEAHNNFIGRCSLGLLMGYDVRGREIPEGTMARATFNVVSEGEHMSKGINACQGQGTCSSAVFGIDFNINSAATYESISNIVSKISPNSSTSFLKDGSTESGINRQSFVFNNGNGFTQNSPNYTASGNVAYKFKNDLEGLDLMLPDPERTLGSYNAALGGVNSFDEFMLTAKSRPVGVWWPSYSAEEINKYFRQGYGVVSP